MTKRVSKAGSVASAVAILVACFVAAPVAAEPDPVQWDAQASKEVAAALHEMHEVWNTGDIAALKELLIGDDVLVTFELDPETHEPIRLTSKQDLDRFVDGIVTDLDKDQAVSLLGDPVLNCRATANFGVCTEECSVSVKTPDGVEERHRLWSTATAVKQDGGWKWIQWHMSIGGPVERYKNGERVASVGRYTFLPAGARLGAPNSKVE